jgi:hypothetical protein
MMQKISRRALVRGFVVVVVAVAGFAAGPALAQKHGGSLTVGLELDDRHEEARHG